MDKQKIKIVLSEFIRTSPTIEATAVMTRDGLPVASRLNEGVDSDRLSAMSAALLSLAERALDENNKGKLESVLIHGSDGFIIMVRVGENAVLSIISKLDSKLGMLLHEAKKAAKLIASVTNTN